MRMHCCFCGSEINIAASNACYDCTMLQRPRATQEENMMRITAHLMARDEVDYVAQLRQRIARQIAKQPYFNG